MKMYLAHKLPDGIPSEVAANFLKSRFLQHKNLLSKKGFKIFFEAVKIGTDGTDLRDGKFTAVLYYNKFKKPRFVR